MPLINRWAYTHHVSYYLMKKTCYFLLLLECTKVENGTHAAIGEARYLYALCSISDSF